MTLTGYILSTSTDGNSVKPTISLANYVRIRSFFLFLIRNFFKSNLHFLWLSTGINNMEAPWHWGSVFTFTASISLVPIAKFTISWMNERISSSPWYHPILSECVFPVPNRFPLAEDPLLGSSCWPSLVLQSLPKQPQSHSFPFCWKFLIIHSVENS